MSLPPEQPEPSATPDGIVPPPAVTEEPLRRPKPPLWKRLGGEGLAASVIIHLLLIILAAIWVVSTITDQAKKDPNTFATGAGGGNGGERAKEFKTRAQPKNAKTLAKMPSRITSKSATAAISVPDMPSVNTATLTSGLTGGGNSKGFGGGSGGGIGSGTGIGRGNGKNFVSLFGMKGAAINYGITGTFYDFKQTRAGKPNALFGNPDADYKDKVNSKQNSLYVREVKEFLVEKNWAVTALADKYKAPDALYASQIFIPSTSASVAPKAYGVEDKVKPSRWMAHYKGTVKCPQTARIRFVGSGDDWLVVRWAGKISLDCGFSQYVVGKENVYKDYGGMKCTDSYKFLEPDRPLHCGPWIQINAGQEAPIEIALGETPGGGFLAMLCFEVMGDNGKGSGPKLLRFTKDDLPDEIRAGAKRVPGGVDLEAKGWIFTPVKSRP